MSTGAADGDSGCCGGSGNVDCTSTETVNIHIYLLIKRCIKEQDF
jgi:hypothetical protein